MEAQGQPQKRKRKPKKNQKKYEDLKHSGRTKRKRQMEDAFKEVTNTLDNEITEVKVELSFESGNSMSFKPRKADKTSDALEWERKERENKQLVQQCLIIKDKYRISDEAMHELHMLKQVIPSKNQIQDERQRLNTVLPIYQHEDLSVDCSTRKIEDVLSYVLQLPRYQNIATGDRISLMLRFACDGAKITKKLNSVRGVFKILEDRSNLPNTLDDLSMSPEDELTLFFFMGDESRLTLERLAKTSFRDMRALDSGLEVLEKQVDVTWIMTCDWKAAALLKGINPARCEHFCLWCYCTKKQICDFTIPSWPIQRSAEDQKNDLPTKSRGYILEDLVEFIPYSRLVPDDLHLRIRISLKLFNQVVTWSIDQKTEKALETELARIGASFHFWEERGDDKGTVSVKKWSQPSGDDLRIIIKQLQIHNVLERREDRHLVTVGSLTLEQFKDELEQRGLPKKGKKTELVARLQGALGNQTKIRKRPTRSRLQVSYSFDETVDDDEAASLDIDALQELWNDFDVLMEALRELPSAEKYIEPNQYQEMARKWAQNFRKYTFDEDVIPYIHALVYHVPHFLEKYHYLHDIGVSQVERKNFDHRQAYFGSTNRNGGRNKKKDLWADSSKGEPIALGKVGGNGAEEKIVQENYLNYLKPV